MWLIIRDSDSTVAGTNYSHLKPVTPPDHTAKEWHGPEPPCHDPYADDPVYSYDPTLNNPAWAALIQSRVDFGALADQANTEIDWLNATIPQIDTMTLEDLRAVLKRIAQENLKQIKAWRYLFRRLG